MISRVRLPMHILCLLTLLSPVSALAEDWSMWRHNVERTSATDEKLSLRSMNSSRWQGA